MVGNGIDGRSEGDVGLQCWEIRGCTLAERASCTAFRAGKSCWEVPGFVEAGDMGVCETCPVVLSRVASAVECALLRERSGVR